MFYLYRYIIISFNYRLHYAVSIPLLLYIYDCNGHRNIDEAQVILLLLIQIELWMSFWHLIEKHLIVASRYVIFTEVIHLAPRDVRFSLCYRMACLWSSRYWRPLLSSQHQNVHRIDQGLAKRLVSSQVIHRKNTIYI